MMKQPFKKVLRAAAVFAVLAFGNICAEAADRRVALVVGNSAYLAVPQLPNPRNDAVAVADALKKSGFEVITAFDVDHLGFDSALQTFIRSLNGTEISVFYYSGHGMQVGGDNRIIPTDARLKSPADLEVETVSVNTVMSYMKSGSKLQLVFLDSCRTNPFPNSSFLVGPEKQMLMAGVGLAPQESALGSLVAFSTQPGAVAVDGTGDNSPFTQAMLGRSFNLGIDVKTALKNVTEDVWQATSRKQKPWTSDSLGQTVFFKRPAVRLAPAEQTVASDAPKVKIAAAPSQDEKGSTANTSLPAANQIADILSQALSKPQRVPIGVGRVAMLDSLPIVRAAGPDQIEMTMVPEAGTLYLDGQILGVGDVLNQDALRKVTFEPTVDSNKKLQEFGLQVGNSGDGTPTKVIGKLEPYIVQCDQEAGEPLDLQGVGVGKLPNEIDPVKAVAACMEAVSTYPDIARYKYELGRAKLAAKDTVGALELFKAAADAGHMRAENQLGYMAQGGYGRPQNLAEANGHFKVASDRGDPFGMLSYGRNLVQGRGVAKNIATGTKLLNKSVELGHTYAMNELGSMYFYGRGVKRNPARGLRFWEAALSHEDIYAMRNIGIACLHGVGTKRDWMKALALFKKASDGGHPSAPTDIGAMYFNGNGVPKDLSTAAKWYVIGAERGDPWAASNLAHIYAEGPANLRDLEKAVQFSGLSVALDKLNDNPANKAFLRALPDGSKRNAIKALIAEVGASNTQTGMDLDETLISLSWQAWRNRNPRVDLF